MMCVVDSGERVVAPCKISVSTARNSSAGSLLRYASIIGSRGLRVLGRAVYLCVQEMASDSDLRSVFVHDLWPHAHRFALRCLR